MKNRQRTGNGNTTRSRNVEVQRGSAPRSMSARSTDSPRSSSRVQSLSRSYPDWQPMGRELMSYPIDMLRRFRHDMDRFFEDMNPSRSDRQTMMSVWSPRTEMLERDGKFVVRLEIPGVDKEDVKVMVSGERLVIEGERRQKDEQQGTSYYETECMYGRFYREISLPEGVDSNDVKANFNNGVLEVSLPQPQNTTERREIPIES